ncbi:MAG: acyltransferase [Bacteroidota bacterium]
MSFVRRLANRLRREGRGMRMQRYLRRHGVVFGPGPSYQHALPIIYNQGTLRVGARFRVSSFQTRPELGTHPEGRLLIGDHVFVNKGASIYACGEIEIGDHCLVADYATIWDSSFHEVSPEDPAEPRPVRLGRNVWIGRGAMVMPGVHIGDHAVVAAGSVVTKDVPSRTVVAGVPTRVIKTFECADDYVRK